MSGEQTTSPDRSVKKIGELIRSIRIAMLTTEDSDGVLHSRPMATQETDFDGDIWFLTRGDSGKAAEIRHDAQVNLSYVDSKGSKFVSIAGTAKIVQNRAKIHELWNATYKAWFPGGKDDPSIAVIRVKATEAEYWESSSSALVRAAKIALATATGGRTEAGKNEKVTL